jgi:hypothetical protein
VKEGNLPAECKSVCCITRSCLRWNRGLLTCVGFWTMPGSLGGVRATRGVLKCGLTATGATGAKDTWRNCEARVRAVWETRKATWDIRADMALTALQCRCINYNLSVLKFRTNIIADLLCLGHANLHTFSSFAAQCCLAINQSTISISITCRALALQPELSA